MVQSTMRVGREADQELERRVRGTLAGRAYASLKRLDVEAANGTITLRGQVASFYEKQIAFSSCQGLTGVLRIVDFVGVG